MCRSAYIFMSLAVFGLFDSAPANALQQETLCAHAPLADEVPRGSERQLETYFRLYFYMNPADLTDRFIIILTTKGWRARCQDIDQEVYASGKEPDTMNPSLKLFIPNTSIRFYLPTTVRNELPESGWRYDDCYFTKIDERYRLSTDMDKVWTVLIESRCQDMPTSAARYTYDEESGLIAVTIGEVTMTSGVETFRQSKTYVVSTAAEGFGSGK